MTAPKEPIRESVLAQPESARAAQPEWHTMYRAMMTELMAKIDMMVDRSVAAHLRALVAEHSSAEHASAEPIWADHSSPVRSAKHLAEPARAPAAMSTPAAAPYIQDVRLAQPGRTEPPNWLQLFTMPDQVRFTRTPDAVLQYERARLQQPEPEPVAEPQSEQDYEPDHFFFEPHPDPYKEPPAPRDDVVPLWRRPFVVPPNVRFTRTPDRKRVPEPPAVEPVDGTDGAMAHHGGETEYEIIAAQALADAAAADTADENRYWESLFEDEAARRSEAETTPASHATAEMTTPTWLGTVWQGQQEAFRSVYEQDNDIAAPNHASTQMHAGAQLAAQHAADPLAASLAQSLAEPLVVETAAPEGVASPLEEAERVKDTIARFIASVTPATAVPAANPAAVAAIKPTVVSRTVQDAPTADADAPDRVSAAPVVQLAPVRLMRQAPAAQGSLAPFGKRKTAAVDPETYEYPPIELLAEPKKPQGVEITGEMLEQNARLLEGVLEDFAIRGEIINVRPGPVVTLYELEPAPGIKSSRVIGLSDDIARSMSAISARVAVVQGRNVIGIELPNERRETVFLRELAASEEFSSSKHKLAIALGKTIGGEPVIVDLARMPHLLVAGTTGSGKSVAINTMILSLLYRLRPDECRLIMVDPKMLELSVYDGIPHLLTPVVTDPKKAVVALKWAVREMEDRYKKMSKVGVRNIDGFNVRVSEARARGEIITRTVQTGYDRNTGEPVFETEAMDLAPIPYIVVIVDEMADLMMVAGKDIEGAIQRLAQMARAAGIHLIMATQRPSVDVITGTIKANFPTRISFQVTSKIDSRTILGEQGAEQLLGQGDMLHMVGGGRIARVHGPFVSDAEVEAIVAHLKTQGHPDYLDVTTEESTAEEAGEAETGEDKGNGGTGAASDKNAYTAEDNDLYEQAVKTVLRDKKCSTSYIQRRLQVGYNKAASLVERMEKNGMVGPANHAGKREILVYSRDLRMMEAGRGEEE